MDDSAIIDLFWARDERAISETKTKYGRLCHSIAFNILTNRQDAEECESDTWMQAWNSIPPQRPSVLSAYLGKIARNLALNRWKSNHAEKRGGGEVLLSLDELADCVSGLDPITDQPDDGTIIECIERFLDTVSPEKQRVFLLRYWQLEPVAVIARRCGCSESKIASMLFHLRKKLRLFLEKEGIDI